MANGLAMRQFGKYSFGAFLFHQIEIRYVILFQFFGLYTFKTGYDGFILAMMLTYLFGISFHYLVETRMKAICENLISKINSSYDVPPVVNYSPEDQKHIVNI